MIYSVYDYQTGKYAYYKAPAKLPASGWFRDPIGNVPTPESIAAPLPAGAKYIGQGTQAKGIVATTSVSLEPLHMSLMYRLPGWAKAAALLGAGFFLGRKFR